jgi:dipeptidyl aminopeptidase/acylaminoacyl peptidase
VLEVFGARDGYRYELIDWEPVHAQALGDVYAGLDAIAEVRTIRYRAADGLEIPAQLTLPRDRPERALPLILLAHDGPALVAANRFDWWAQALAAQGYAVLQPNFRGSDLGRQFIEAGYNEWGRKMQSDLSDGVQYLSQQGVVDPKRVCIAGRGYGGYAALAGVTLQNGIYRCAVSVGGISELDEFIRWTADHSLRGDNLAVRNWDRYLGASGPRDPALRVLSPNDHVAAVSVPVLLVHGRDDTVVPYDQSADMAKALKRAGKSVGMVTLDHEDHWLSSDATRLKMLEASTAFLEANNPAY